MARITWNSPETGEKAQFVADIMKESLFNYAFDSYKAPALNLHFFCNDYIETSGLVEKGVMKDGNMIPAVEEFEHILKNSFWLPDGVNVSLMSFKNKQGYYKDISQDKNFEQGSRAALYKESAIYIREVLSANRPYAEMLLNHIQQILSSYSFEFEEKRELYFCVREFLSELINCGVSKYYLYSQTLKKLFSNLTPEDDVQYIIDFLKSFFPNQKKYAVVFGITAECYTEMKDILRGFRLADTEEHRRLGYNYVAETKVKAFDPVSALIDSKRMLSEVLSIYNSCMHSTNLILQDRGLVKEDGNDQYHVVNDKSNLLSKNKNKTKPERIKFLHTAVRCGLTNNLISAFELHNHALKTDEPQTQLLNLWTIIELLIGSKQDQMNRINYISNALCAILNNVYWNRLITTLYNQIILTPDVKTIIRSETRGKNDIEKLALILKDNQPLQAQIIAKLAGYPLEIYRLELFAEILSSSENMKSYIERHANRLRWQIMRIYRNRCMIVHDGSHFDYLDIIVENLHYYVDELFDFIFSKMDIGVSDMQAILSYARMLEANKLAILSGKEKNLSDDAFLQVVFKI